MSDTEQHSIAHGPTTDECPAGAPELYRLLVIDRGWKTERYMLSLTKLLVDQLLLPAAQDS
jgi:hypothetical protein